MRTEKNKIAKFTVRSGLKVGEAGPTLNDDDRSGQCYDKAMSYKEVFEERNISVVSGCMEKATNKKMVRKCNLDYVERGKALDAMLAEIYNGCMAAES